MARFGSLGTQYFGNDGDPLIDGKIYFFESGTDTDKDTFADVNLSIKNTNPVILSGAGRQPNVFFNGSAKGILTDKNDVQIEPRDPLGGESEEGAFSDWNSVTIFNIPDIVIGSDGLFYLSITDGNQDNDPTSDAVNWTEVRFIRVWNVNETYSENRIVEASNGLLYTSLVDSNLGNDPIGDVVNWKASTLLESSWVAQTKVTTYQVLESDNRSTIGCDGTFTISLADAAAVIVAADSGGFQVTIKNIGSGVITVGRLTGADTIDGTAADITLIENESVVLKVNAAGDGYNILSPSVLKLGYVGTIAELNNIDGDTAATSTTSAGADRVVYNDDGVMKQVALTDLDTYFSATTKTLTNKTAESLVLNTGVSGTAIETTITDTDTKIPSSGAVFDKVGGLNTLPPIDIGDWDMNATQSVSIAHGLTLSKIRTVDALIRRDDDAVYIKLNSGPTASDSTPQGHIGVINATTVTLSRITGGSFDNTTWDSTSFNRGWIIIQYTD